MCQDGAITRQYYKYSPEYIIEHFRCDDRDGYEYYLFSQSDSRPRWYNINVKYHQTTLSVSYTHLTLPTNREV